jgi:hypothetical protein
MFYSITSSRRLIHHFIPFALWYGRKRAKVDPGSGGFSDRVECCDAFSAESRRRAACLLVGQKRFGTRRHSCSKELLQISIDGSAAASSKWPPFLPHLPPSPKQFELLQLAQE